MIFALFSHSPLPVLTQNAVLEAPFLIPFQPTGRKKGPLKTQRSF